MSTLNMLELHIDIGALHHFLYLQGYAGKEVETELGYGVHAWLQAAFGERAPKPWRLLMDKNRPPRILGYSSHDAQALKEYLLGFGDPSVVQVCPDPSKIASRQMPSWRKGRRLGYQVLTCPVGRKARNGVEKDLFLIKADEVDRETIVSRETVYGEWIERKFEEYGVIAETVELTGFRVVKQFRQTQHSRAGREQRQIMRPQALLEGELTIECPDRFSALLAHGVGRHRAFGYGMVLLRPIR